VPDDGPPLLLLLNGPPGAGKSTLARCYAADHPLTLNLDIDLIRRGIGGWQDRPQESGLLARALALASARVHLGAGYDVVVPQLLARPAFIELLEALAREIGAGFAEVVLVLPEQEAVRRFERRTKESPDPVHAEAAVMARRAGGRTYLRDVHRDLAAHALARPGAVLLDATSDVEVTYANLLRAVSDARE
jgi:predicted kinase